MTYGASCFGTDVISVEEELRSSHIYLAVFRSSYDGYGTDVCGKRYAPLNKALKRGRWPYDLGDDPSFFSSREHQLNLTWGICRQQVRNRVQPGDICVFFAVRQKSRASPFEYSLCAITTVEKKVSQSDIWQKSELAGFRKYLNLLIRPRGSSAWEHSEPGSKKPHKDWLWRICDQNGLRLHDFDELQTHKVVQSHSRIDSRRIAFVANYVIFCEGGPRTFVLPNPPVIAYAETNGVWETWCDGRFAKGVRSRTLEIAQKHGSKRTALRTVHKQHSHPVVRWEMPSQDASGWRSEFVQFIRKHCEQVRN